MKGKEATNGEILLLVSPEVVYVNTTGEAEIKERKDILMKI